MNETNKSKKKDLIDLVSFTIGAAIFGALGVSITIWLMSREGISLKIAYALMAILAAIALCTLIYWGFKRKIIKHLFGIDLKTLAELIINIEADIKNKKTENIGVRLKEILILYTALKSRKELVKVIFIIFVGVGVFLTAGLILQQTNAVISQTKAITKIDTYEPFWLLHNSKENNTKLSAFVDLIEQDFYFFSGIKVSNISLLNQSLSGFKCTSCSLNSCYFNNSDLSSSDFTNSTIRRGSFQSANLSNSTFINVDFVEPSIGVFDGTNLNGANMHGISLQMVNLSTAKDLRNVDFTDASLNKIRFGGKSLIGTKFSNLDWLMEADLDLSGAVVAGKVCKDNSIGKCN